MSELVNNDSTSVSKMDLASCDYKVLNFVLHQGMFLEFVKMRLF